MSYTKRELISKLAKCHDEIKNHPFRNGFERRYVGDYKLLLYQLTEIWCDLIYKCNELPEIEERRFWCFGEWIHDFRQYLRTWDSTTFPMYFFDYYEQMLQVTHNFIDSGDLSTYYNLNCYFTENGKIIKSTKYEWITAEDCGIDSDILPRYLPINAPLVVDDDKIKEYFSTGYYAVRETEQREARFQYWLKNTKPVLEWLNKQRKSIDMIQPIWQSAIITPSRCKASGK